MYQGPRPPIILSDRIAFLIMMFRKQFCEQGVAARVSDPLLHFMVNYLSRTCARLLKIIASPPKIRPPRPRPNRPDRVRKPNPIPGGFNWLRRLIPNNHILNGHAVAFQQLLNEADMRELIEANPTTGRLLRPLCRMFGIKPPAGLQRPPRPKRPKRPTRPRRPKPAKPPETPPDFPALHRPAPVLGAGNHYLVFPRDFWRSSG
ncbi:hypothetical protein [Acidiphilium sp.]|uniref:hypothetical protein n=1 Tax=Acidiphilium sp. TaxID=527 RepID=UPI003CFE557E